MKAYEVIAKKSDWIKGHQSLDAHGNWVPAELKSAVKFCAVGAIRHAYGTGPAGVAMQDKMLSAVRPLCNFVADWNDRPERTHAEVISLLKKLDI